MALLPNLRRLLIPRKGSNKVTDLDINWRAIERWAEKVGGIQEITSNDHSVTIVDPFGPVTDLSATGGGGYKSLTGPGQFATPGKLTQAGDFTVDGDTTVVGIFESVGSSAFFDTTGNVLAQAGSGSDLASVWVNATSIFRDPGTVSFQGTGGSSSTNTVVQFVFVIVAPTFTVTAPTFAFFASAVGHIYYNPGGGSWTLLI